MSYQISYDDDSQMKPMDVWQLMIFYLLHRTAVQFPKNCHTCGSKVKGNRIIGYRMGCRNRVHRYG